MYIGLTIRVVLRGRVLQRCPGLRQVAVALHVLRMKYKGFKPVKDTPQDYVR
jgi:hypothetical protein